MAYSPAGFIWTDAAEHGKIRGRFRRIYHRPPLVEKFRQRSSTNWTTLYQRLYQRLQCHCLFRRAGHGFTAAFRREQLRWL